MKKSGMGREFSARDCVHSRLRFVSGHSLGLMRDVEGERGKETG